METQNPKRRPETENHSRKNAGAPKGMRKPGIHPSGARNSASPRSHVPPTQHLAKPFIDINDLEGSADALRKLADQLESMQSHREHRNLEAYSLPRGHFVKRVNEQMPEHDSGDDSENEAHSKHAKSKRPHDDEEEGQDQEDGQDQDEESSDETDTDKKKAKNKKEDSKTKKAKQHASSDDQDNQGEDQEDGEQKDDEKKEGDKEKKKKSKFKFTPGRIAAMAAVLIILLSAAGIFFYHMHTYESTDDALVQAHTTLLAPKVSGIVTQVLVDEHQRVKAGQVLVRIEPKDFNANLDNARANLESMKVQLKNAKRDLGRASELVRDHAITQQDYDHALANYQDLDRKTRAAMSDVEESELNLAYTEIRAPTDGMIGRKSVEVGMNAAAGTALMGFVQSDERWVIANFKETQLSSIKPGKKVKVEVDAIPGREFEGVVESISPSSGATFTLFPPDNATGNFTKVVQRVPVKIYLKNLSEEDMENLQAGLSAVVSVYKHSDGESIPSRPFLTYRSQVGQSLPEDAQSDSYPADPRNNLQQAQELPLDQQKPLRRKMQDQQEQRDDSRLPNSRNESCGYGR